MPALYQPEQNVNEFILWKFDIIDGRIMRSIDQFMMKCGELEAIDVAFVSCNVELMAITAQRNARQCTDQSAYLSTSNS